MRSFAIVISCALSLMLPVAALGTPTGSIVVRNAWAPATPPFAEIAVGYLTLENHGTDDTLLALSTEAAERAELHQMIVHGGVMNMRPVKGGFPIAAGATLTLEPGGNHIMFIRPKQPFVASKYVAIRLHFEHAGTIEVILSVRPAPPPARYARHRPA